MLMKKASYMLTTFIGFIWWSTYFSLPSTIWFFPLNELEITGYEAFALLCTSPLITVIPIIRRIVCSQIGGFCLSLATVCALLSLFADSSLSRLIAVSAANGTAMLWICNAWWDRSEQNRCSIFLN